mmetsp:Transcript_48273/g.109687  ORF Transcript_48273/g.109687 Transcript_48273/m.109687 type:complete len:130 (+) Transcript_48273:128-517(+)
MNVSKAILLGIIFSLHSDGFMISSPRASRKWRRRSVVFSTESPGINPFEGYTGDPSSSSVGAYKYSDEENEFRKSRSLADETILQRPGPEPWMFDEEGNLKEMQVKFDWKAVDFRQDMLGGNEPNMLEG